MCAGAGSQPSFREAAFSVRYRPGKAGRFSAAASVGPERSPLGTRTPVSLAFSHALRACKGKTVGLCPTPCKLFEKSLTKNFYARCRSAPLCTCVA